MSVMPLQVYEAIKPKLGEKEAQILLEPIARQTEISTKDLATKADIRDMATREDLAKLEARLIKWNVGSIIAVAGLTLAIVKLIG